MIFFGIRAIPLYQEDDSFPFLTPVISAITTLVNRDTHTARDIKMSTGRRLYDGIGQTVFVD